MTALYYGLTNPFHAKKLAKRVVSVLGGGDPAYCLLLETACAETQLGTFPDAHIEKWGVGLCQHDQINIEDLLIHAKRKHFDLINTVFGYDLHAMELKDLALDPLLSLICCRLSYKRIPESIPNDLYGRARYWKEHYNRTGDGTVEHYLSSVKNCLGAEWQ
jgi:hypothetical protein